MRYEALAHENDELRGLQEALPPVAERWIVAEIVDIQLNSLRQRVLINRGSRNGLFKGQAVMDDKGLLGQTTHVGPFSAEVILITDPEHAVPVQIDRTGLRTIAVGTGDTASLALPYLPANADVKVGDVLNVDMPNRVEASVDGVPLFECEYGTSGSQYALKIGKVLAVTQKDNQLGDTNV